MYEQNTWMKDALLYAKIAISSYNRFVHIVAVGGNYKLL